MPSDKTIEGEKSVVKRPCLSGYKAFGILRAPGNHRSDYGPREIKHTSADEVAEHIYDAYMRHTDLLGGSN